MRMIGGKSADHRFATDLQRPRRLPILNDLYHVGQRPKLGCDVSGHRRGNPQALMDADEVVMHEVDRDRVPVVLGLLDTLRAGLR